MTDSTMVFLTREELGYMLQLRMVADPMPHTVNVDVLDAFLDRAAAELGFTDWLDAYHSIP
jgi:hypothetical protein